MNQTIHAAERLAEHVPVLGGVVGPLKRWRDFIRAEDIEGFAARLPEPGEAASPFDRITYIWLKGGIELAEAAYCMVVVPFIGVWLILPMQTFATSPLFRYMAVVPEEIWGLGMLAVSLAWFIGLTSRNPRARMVLRKVGSLSTAMMFMAIFLSMALSMPAAIANPLTLAQFGIVGFLFVRQGWETGAGDA